MSIEEFAPSSLKICNIFPIRSGLSFKPPRRSLSLGDIQCEEGSHSKIELTPMTDREITYREDGVGELMRYNRQILEELQHSKKEIKDLSQKNREMSDLNKQLLDFHKGYRVDLKHLIKEVDCLKELKELKEPSLAEALKARNKEIKDLKTQLENLYQEHQASLGELEYYKEQFSTQREEFFKMYKNLQEKMENFQQVPLSHIKEITSKNKELEDKVKETRELIHTLMEHFAVKSNQELVKKVREVLDKSKRRDTFMNHIVDLAVANAPTGFFDEKVCLKRLHKWLNGVFHDYFKLKKEHNRLLGEERALTDVKDQTGVNGNPDMYNKLLININTH